MMSPCSLCLSDASMYAHYLFNAFDTAQHGSVKFEVIALHLPSMPLSQFCVFNLFCLVFIAKQ